MSHTGCFHEWIHVDRRGFGFCNHCGQYFGYSVFYAAHPDAATVSRKTWSSNRSRLLPDQGGQGILDQLEAEEDQGDDHS